MDNKEELRLASLECAEDLLQLTILELEMGRPSKVRYVLELEMLLYECTKINMN